MDEQKSASVKEQPELEGPFRRSYAWPLLWGPWVSTVVGGVLIGSGMFSDAPAEVWITEIVVGAALVFGGTLMPRMKGLLQLGATGLRGEIGGLPYGLILAEHAAENVAETTIPKDAPDREQRAKEATQRAVTVALWQLMSEARAAGWEVLPHTSEDYRRHAMEWLRRQDPPKEPPRAAKKL
jgi:hypothetical protein